MKFFADLHIHSHYSRATSKDLDFEHLNQWAQLKGLQVVGTGDISHPGWLQEMREKLEPAEEGLFRLKESYARAIPVPEACRGPVRFLLAGEISSIYKKYDKVRKVHNVIFAPSLAAVEKIQAALEKIGNIRSDGRPILGLDSRDLLETILEIDPEVYLIPAHIWTPWFSLLGSKSGFDSVEECFGDLTPHIFALETGLSSDPPMNWRISDLDRYTLVSNSDAHSPPKLAREANLFQTELSYPAIFEALQSGDPARFLGTVEFFPEEGKYHLDGHRKCEIRWEPSTTLKHKGLCSECGKPVTVGVMHRVETLADRPEGGQPARTHPFFSLVPLPEVLAQVYGVGVNSRQVQQNYQALLAQLGPELAILQDVPLEQIERAGGGLLAEGIRRMRAGEVVIAGGYDGEYGVIKLFGPQERSTFSNQLGFFAPEKDTPRRSRPPADPPDEAGEPSPGQWTQAGLFDRPEPAAPGEPQLEGNGILAGLNPAQVEAVRWFETPLLIVAGPGTGKTRTLTHRIAYLLAHQNVAPEQILAITFTHKAAGEMADRLAALVGPDTAGRMVIKTFHALGVMLLRAEAARLGLDPDFSIAGEPDRLALLGQLLPELTEKEIGSYLEAISAAKSQLLTLTTPELGSRYPDIPDFVEIYRSYETTLRQNKLLDYDDLILEPVRLLETFPDVLGRYRETFRWISVDEYQDVNLAQYRLLRLLAGPDNNLCVIGDPDQAIYGFRGANRSYFLKFQEDFPEAKVQRLSQNYRSTQLILDASSQVIARNPDSQRLELWSEIIRPVKLDIFETPTDKAEAEQIVHQIEQMVGGTSYFSLDSGRVAGDDHGEAPRSFGDFAVLYRLKAQSLALVEAFERSGMPYQTIGNISLYEYSVIRTILAWLWLLDNPHAGYHLPTILAGLKPAPDRASLAALTALAQERNLPAVEALQEWASSSLTAAQKKQANRVASFLDELLQLTPPPPISGLIERINTFMGAGSSRDPDSKDSERVRQLARRAAPFEHRRREFLETTLLRQETDAYDPRADRVTLMTLHAAKGLEFPVVFIAGCEENLAPLRLPGKTFDLEEERRLFYVGMTRAQQRLILTHAKTRFLFGQKYQNNPSPFLNDIESALKEIKNMAARKGDQEKEAVQLKLF